MDQPVKGQHGRAESPKTKIGTPAQHLTFKIAGETCAIGINRVLEIVQFDTVTKVPSTPPSIRGVMNLRGAVVPVIDLGLRFGLPESPVTKRTCVIILESDLEGERTMMGIMADSVSEVVELKPEDIEPPPPFGTSVKVDYLVGMGKSERKFLLILDIDRALTTEESSLVTEIAQGACAPEPPVEPAPEPPSNAGTAGKAAAAAADDGLERLLESATTDASPGTEEGGRAKGAREKAADSK